MNELAPAPAPVPSDADYAAADQIGCGNRYDRDRIASVVAYRVSALVSRIAQLESYLAKTKDGKLVVECEALYCPQCGNAVRQCGSLCYCDECPNPEDGNEPPLPLFDSSCLSSSPSARSALKERLETLVGGPLKFS